MNSEAFVYEPTSSVEELRRNIGTFEAQIQALYRQIEKDPSLDPSEIAPMIRALAQRRDISTLALMRAVAHRQKSEE